MGFTKKLAPQLKENLEEMNFDELNDYQKLLLPKIKSGANIFGIAPKESGKTSAAILHVANLLMKRVVDLDIPRAVVVVPDEEAGVLFEEKLRPFIHRSGLRTYLINERYDIKNQRHDLFDGVDIAITTAPRFERLFLNNGINLAELEVMLIEDADLIPMEQYRHFNRISESLKKCQYIVFAEELSKKLKTLGNTFMGNAQVIE